MEIHDIKDGDPYVFGRMYRLYARTRRLSAREKAYANQLGSAWRVRDLRPRRR